MRKGFLIYEEMHKYFHHIWGVVSHIHYNFATDPSEFPNIWGKFNFLFYQCRKSKVHAQRVLIDLAGCALVPHFAYRGTSQRRKGAARHVMIWLGYIARLSQWGGGGYFTPTPMRREGYFAYFYLSSRRLGGGGGSETQRVLNDL